MEKINKKLTIIKYGSETLIRKNSNQKIAIDYNNFYEQGEIIDKINNPVIIVSSGAIAFGKSQCCDLNHLEDEIIKKRVLAGIGNPLLSVL
ncbi:MAG: hypothetical protein LRZ98_00870 [Candidatus Pacebacteria bacterium]|nr:hypothetical protein [Candidatus Paceibacterota bacterium]